MDSLYNPKNLPLQDANPTPKKLKAEGQQKSIPVPRSLPLKEKLIALYEEERSCLPTDDLLLLESLCRNGDADAVKILTEYGADINEQDAYGQTALLFAAIESQTEILTYLLGKGADVHSGAPAGVLWYRPLMAAAMSGPLYNVELLLSHGARINDGDDDGKTALMFAAGERNNDIVSFLIEKGADVHQKDADGLTAIMYAIEEWGDETTIAILLNAGANINARDNEGKTALTYARNPKRADGVETFLLEHGAIEA